MKKVLLPKYDPDKSMQENSPSWMDKLGKHPIIICKCGQGTIIENHHVHTNGKIFPCYEHRCGFKALLKLDEYHGAEFKPVTDG